jgi:hypothetical protein
VTWEVWGLFEVQPEQVTTEVLFCLAVDQRMAIELSDGIVSLRKDTVVVTAYESNWALFDVWISPWRRGSIGEACFPGGKLALTRRKF